MVALVSVFEGDSGGGVLLLFILFSFGHKKQTKKRKIIVHGDGGFFGGEAGLFSFRNCRGFSKRNIPLLFSRRDDRPRKKMAVRFGRGRAVLLCGLSCCVVETSVCHGHAGCSPRVRHKDIYDGTSCIGFVAEPFVCFIGHLSTRKSSSASSWLVGYSSSSSWLVGGGGLFRW